MFYDSGNAKLSDVTKYTGNNSALMNYTFRQFIASLKSS